MPDNADYGAVREEVLADARVRARTLAAQGHTAREIEHRLDDELTATERELLWGIVRQEVVEAHKEADQRPEPRPSPKLRPPESLVAGARSVPSVVPVVLVAVAVGVLVGLVVANGGGRGGASSAGDGTTGKHPRQVPASRGSTAATASGGGRPSPSRRATPPVAATGTPSGGGSRSAAQAPVGTASASRLNDQGYQLMNEGRYQDAIPLLRRAVSASPSGSNDLTYAYALYNLGHSLRLAGRSGEAVPLLERRLRIDNQRATVARELKAARRGARSTGGAAP